jgi:hypothetical protein
MVQAQENTKTAEITMRLLLFLLFPAIALAEPSGPVGQIDPQQIFEQSKQMMLPMIEESLPVMKEARSCLEAAQSKDDLKACSELMAELQRKMSSRMGPAMGLSESKEPSMRQPVDIEWNEEVKKNMLIYLDRSILVGTAMQECLNQSSGMEQMQQCMEAKRPKQ